MAWTTLCRLDELQEGQGKYLAIHGLQLALFLHQGQPYVIDNYCPHAGGSLAGGTIENGRVLCPWHYWAFRLSDGQLQHAPAVRVKTYPTRVLSGPDQPSLLQADLPPLSVPRPGG